MKPYALAAAGLLLQASVVFGGELSDDLTARRAALMERLGPDAMLVAVAAPRPRGTRSTSTTSTGRTATSTT